LLLKILFIYSHRKRSNKSNGIKKLFIQIMYVDFRQIIPEKSENIIGRIVMSIYFSSTLLHLLISVNRFYSIVRPFEYTEKFGGKRTANFIILICFLLFEEDILILYLVSTFLTPHFNSKWGAFSLRTLIWRGKGGTGK
uniref:7TM_GPCR_Srx domain-containing protein n=1 Tax=Dracunculus medinensis TaxID=318479 RepID=A0A0N4UBQ3_DRAME